MEEDGVAPGADHDQDATPSGAMTVAVGFNAMPVQPESELLSSVAVGEVILIKLVFVPTPVLQPAVVTTD